MIPKLSRELAEDQIDILCEYYEIEPEFMPEAQKNQLLNARTGLIEQVMRGKLEIRKEQDNSVTCVQFRDGSPSQIVYKVVTGKAKVSMGTKSPTDVYGRIYALMGQLCGLGEDMIQSMNAKDLKVPENLGLLFLLV